MHGRVNFIARECNKYTIYVQTHTGSQKSEDSRKKLAINHSYLLITDVLV